MLWFTLLLAAHFIPKAAIDYRQPQMTAVGNSVAATFASEHAIYFTESQDDGKTWDEPLTIAKPATLALGNHRGPRVVTTRGALVISAISEGALVTWRSTDSGKTWQAGAKVTDVAQAAREGLHAMAAAPDGRLFATWLDLRNVAPGKQGTELWGAYSSDAGLTWSKNFVVYKSPSGSICTCCHPSAMFDSQGTLLVMWRNALKGNRDMYLLSSKDGGRTFSEPEKLGSGSWALNACPMDGGALVQNTDGKIMTIWRREKNVYLASEGGSETMLHEGKNPTMVAAKGGLYAAWTSTAGVFARVPGHAEPVLLDHEGGFVTLTSVPNGAVVAAWERKGTIQFHTLP